MQAHECNLRLFDSGHIVVLLESSRSNTLNGGIGSATTLLESSSAMETKDLAENNDSLKINEQYMTKMPPPERRLGFASSYWAF